MELTREPSQNNIKLLQGIKGFAKFEKEMLEKNKTIRSLTIGPNTQFIEIIAEMMHLKDELLNFTINEISDCESIPKNYFDIIVWGNFDPETNLRDLKCTLSFLGDGSIYIPLILFEPLFRKCLSTSEYKMFPANYDNISTILKTIYSELDLQILRYNFQEYIRLYFPTGENVDIDIDIDTKKFNEQIFTNVLADKDPCYNIPKCDKMFGKKLEREIRDFYNKIDNEIDNFLRSGIDTEIDILKRLEGFDYSHLTSSNKWLIELIRKKVIEHLAEKTPIHITTRYPTIVSTAPLPIVMKGLRNIGDSSCFLDSILVALLFNENGYFPTALKNKTGLSNECQSLRDELIKLTNVMKGDKQYTCNPIIDKLKRCDKRTNVYLIGEQYDDYGILQSLFDVMSLEPTTININKAFGNGDEWINFKPQTIKTTLLEVNIPDTKQDIVELYQNEQIIDYKNVPINDQPIGPDGKHYTLVKTSNTIIDSDLIVFHTMRIKSKTVNSQVEYFKDNRPISFTQFISGNDKKYELTAVTIHEGKAQQGHYTTFFKYNGVWFYYNDLKKNVKQTSWSTVKEKGSKDSSLFLYSPI